MIGNEQGGECPVRRIAVRPAGRTVASGTQNRQLNLPRESRLLQTASGRETAASSRQKEIKNTGIAGFSGQTISVLLRMSATFVTSSH